MLASSRSSRDANGIRRTPSNGGEYDESHRYLCCAGLGNDLGQNPIPVKVNQETLAALIETTRSRVNVFLDKFRKLGLINYNGKLEVHKALLNFVLHERPQIAP